jgi:hypothetical protein
MYDIIYSFYFPVDAFFLKQIIIMYKIECYFCFPGAVAAGFVAVFSAGGGEFGASGLVILPSKKGGGNATANAVPGQGLFDIPLPACFPN